MEKNDVKDKRMFCSNCGTENKENAKFCGKCGEPLSSGSKSNPRAYEEDPTVGSKGKSRKKLMAGGIAIVLILCIIVGFAVSRIGSTKLMGNTNTNIANGASIAQDGDWIYYVMYDAANEAYNLMKSKQDGSEAQKLTHGGYLSSIFAVDEWIYYVGKIDEISHDIYRIGTDGSNKEKIAEGNKIFGITGKKIYYLNQVYDEGESEYLICRMEMDGQEKEVLYKGTDDNYIDSAQIDNKSIYFIESQYSGEEGNKKEFIKKMDLDGENQEILQTSEDPENSTKSNICVIDDKIYYIMRFEEDYAGFEQYAKQDSNIWENSFGFVLSAIDKADGENKEDIYISAWIEQYLVKDEKIYIYRFDDDYDDSALVKIDTSDREDVEYMDIGVEGNIFDLQIVDDWFYYNNYEWELYGDGGSHTWYRMKFGDIEPQVVTEIYY